MENELIDISSDDSDDGQVKTANGASTSHPRSENKDDGPKQNDKPHKATDRGKKRKIEEGTLSPQKKRKNITQFQESKITFKDIGGLDNVLQEVCKLLLHVAHPEIYRRIGISPPRGFLLHGPPGSGKTLLASAIAGVRCLYSCLWRIFKYICWLLQELSVPLMKVAAPELVAGVSGESEERIRELFELAIAAAPCVLFIDEIDAITPNRQNAQKEMERRIVAQLLISLDGIFTFITNIGLRLFFELM